MDRWRYQFTTFRRGKAAISKSPRVWVGAKVASSLSLFFTHTVNNTNTLLQPGRQCEDSLDMSHGDDTKHHQEFTQEIWYLAYSRMKLLTHQLAANMKSFPGKWRVIQFSWHQRLIQDQSFEYLLSSPSLLAGRILTPLPRKHPQTSTQLGVIGNPGVCRSFTQVGTISSSAQPGLRF